MNLHKIIFSFSVLLLLGYIAFLIIKFPYIQETIPIHYSSEGADGFGNKMFLWLEVEINAIILSFIGMVIFFPQKMFKKSDDHLDFLENSFEEAIKNRQIFLSVLSVIITLIFCGTSIKEII
ncbi:hypothetical protein ASG22_12025 [Chryseobacterium sp. Leaf405]|uniref:DUF1648 domain-containing protein n=1 Tax=Chryseobacterium sp. Leaf405 TaxID=1736367 RepID=UPI0006FFA4A3|nr:DUF1648 domain-containing protein [Chryseobacterium sp. Leaf405]KQT24709.1 hypothetical protein ASG22_12025 [Chryseobacterium sp. Leaf405]